MFLESKNSFSFKTERFFYLSIFQLVSNYSGRKVYVPSQRFETVLFFRRVAIVWRARKIGMRFYKQNGEHDIEWNTCRRLVWTWKNFPILAKNSKSKSTENIHCFSYWDSPLTRQIIQLFSPKQCSLYSVIHSKYFFSSSRCRKRREC